MKELPEYVTVHQASKMLGHRHYKNLQLWVDQHGLTEAAHQRTANGIVKMYKYEDIAALAELHAADVVRRGAVSGLAPKGFEYTQVAEHG